MGMAFCWEMRVESSGLGGFGCYWYVDQNSSRPGGGGGFWHAKHRQVFACICLHEGTLEAETEMKLCCPSSYRDPAGRIKSSTRGIQQRICMFCLYKIAAMAMNGT